MICFMVMVTMALAAMSGAASAMQNVTSTNGASASNRHACGPGYDYICSTKPRRCSCVPRPQ